MGVFLLKRIGGGGGGGGFKIFLVSIKKGVQGSIWSFGAFKVQRVRKFRRAGGGGGNHIFCILQNVKC